jgi:hypothetical protein
MPDRQSRRAKHGYNFSMSTSFSYEIATGLM